MFPHRKWFCSICFINISHFSFIFWYDFRQSFHYLCVWININVQLFSSLSNIMWRNVNSSIKSVNDAELYRVIGGNGVNSNKGNQYFFICMSVRSECQYSHQTMTKSCIVLQSIFSPFLIFFSFLFSKFHEDVVSPCEPWSWLADGTKNGCTRLEMYRISYGILTTTHKSRSQYSLVIPRWFFD